MLPSNLSTVITYLVDKHENTLHHPIPKPQHSEMLLFHPPATLSNDTQNSYAAKAESGTLQNRAEKPRKSIIFLLAVSLSQAHDKSAQRA